MKKKQVAKKAAPKKEAPKKKTFRRRRRNNEMSGFMPLVLMALAGLAVFKFELAALTAVGIIPTFVLAFTGKGENKSEKLQCVCFANLTGVLFKFNIVLERPSMLTDILTNPMNILVMWGAAAFGYALIYLGPWAAAYFLQAMSEDKLKKLNQQRQSLVDQWGHEVLGDKDEGNKPNL